MRFVWLVTTFALAAGCRTAAPPPAADSAPVADASASIGTFTKVTMVRRVLDGGKITSGTEVLVVYGDRRAEIRDRDSKGPLMKQGTVDPERFATLRDALASGEWSSLVAERGTVVPDGPAYTIEVRGARVTRHDNPDDEPVVKKAAAAFKQVWTDLDR